MDDRFHLYFRSEAGAHSAAQILRGRGFEVKVRAPDEHVDRWAVRAAKEMPSSTRSPRFLLTEWRLNRLATARDGEYDGYDRAVG